MSSFSTGTSTSVDYVGSANSSSLYFVHTVTSGETTGTIAAEHGIPDDKFYEDFIRLNILAGGIDILNSRENWQAVCLANATPENLQVCNLVIMPGAKLYIPDTYQNPDNDSKSKAPAEKADETNRQFVEGQDGRLEYFRDGRALAAQQALLVGGARRFEDARSSALSILITSSYEPSHEVCGVGDTITAWFGREVLCNSAVDDNRYHYLTSVDIGATYDTNKNNYIDKSEYDALIAGVGKLFPSD